MNSNDVDVGLKQKRSWRVICLFLLASSPGILNSMHLNAFVFMAEAPVTWCKIPPLLAANWTRDEIRNISIANGTLKPPGETCDMYGWNYTELSRMGYQEAIQFTSSNPKPKVVPCEWGYSYDEPVTSITSEWDLVCQNNSLRSAVQGAVAFGKLVGFFGFSTLADKFGRRPVFLVCSMLYMAAGPAVALAPDFYFLLAMRIFIGFAGAGVYEVGYTILSEMTVAKYRAWCCCLYNLSYAVGIVILPCLAIFSYSWRTLQWCISALGFILLVHCWFMPESPRWLMIEKRYKEAYKVLYGSKVPGNIVVPEDGKPKASINCSSIFAGVLEWASSLVTFNKLFSTCELRSRIIICYLGWFTARFSYHLIGLNGDVSGNKYIYVALHGFVEAPGYLIPPILMISPLGRKPTGFILFIIMGIALLAILALPGGTPVQYLALIGRLCWAALFAIIILHTAELFPTSIRNTAIGTSLCMAQLGLILAPFVVKILEQLAWFLPSALCGILCLVTGSVVLLLPETKNRPMPDTRDDINNAPPESKVSFRNWCSFR